jgi:hypothetical protein
MNKPHKHAELIKQWADGAEIEELGELTNAWYNCPHPSWGGDITYRIKSQPVEIWINYHGGDAFGWPHATKKEAVAATTANGRVVHMREVVGE